MKIKFIGATGTVTGSKYLVETQNTKILIDCGLFQGYKNLRDRNWKPFPFEVSSIDAVFLTHAHLDHSGMIPLLYKNGYRGPVHCSRATFELCKLLLQDSGHLQDEEARFRNKHKMSKHSPALPLYGIDEAKACLSLFAPVGFGEKITAKDFDVEFSPVGHILGASSIRITNDDTSVVFTGDVGRPNDLIMYPPTPLKSCDYLIIESTYGNRLHDIQDPVAKLESIVKKTVAKGGAVLIPSFAVGRSQSIMFVLSELMKANRIPNLPIFLDSPMAINASGIYCHFNDEHRLDKSQCNLMCEHVEYTRSVDESKNIATIKYPHIIISASGMATGGRVLHHLTRLIQDHRNTIVFAGYQAGGTRGQKLTSGSKKIRIFGKDIDVEAEIDTIPGFSAHADYNEMIRWLKQSNNLAPKHVFVTHGEEEAADAFRLHLKDAFNWDVSVPDYLEEFQIK
jgi:metallo-beta-lactamase family protein